jgi:hypothetical protein
MPHAMLQTSEDNISGILNWVCPECGGPIGGRIQEFKCQGECLRDWRDVWESRLAKPGKNTNSPQAPGKQYEDYAPNGAARVLVHKSANEFYAGRQFRGGRRTLRPVVITVAEAKSERQTLAGMRRNTT